MSGVQIEANSFGFGELPALDGDGFLARLSDPAENGLADYPLFDAGRGLEPSGSRWMDRGRLAEALAAYNAEMGNELTDEVRDAVAGSGVFVIAGQQPGLLMGPMYAFLKAVSVLAWARRLNEQTGKRVVQGFWIASEDNDVAEVNHVYVNGQRFSCDHEVLNAGGSWPPVGTVSLEDYRGEIMAFLDGALFDNDFKAELVEVVEQAGFENYADSFARQLGQLFAGQGLVLIDPNRLRGLTGPVLAEAVRCWVNVEEAFANGKQQNAAAGVAAPIERVGLFELIDGRREAVAIDADGATVGGERRSLAAAGDYIESHVELFSPNAALRPVLQDAVFPNAVTLGGPSELKYLWQIDPIYKALNVKRSALYPRVSATVVTGAVLKKARRAGVDGEAMWSVLDRLTEAEEADGTAVEDSPEVTAVNEAAKELVGLIEGLPTQGNVKLIKNAVQSISHQVDKVTGAMREERLAEVGRSQKDLQRIGDEVMPRGKPQDRVASVYDFLNRYGLDWVEAMVDAVDPSVIGHWLIETRHVR